LRSLPHTFNRHVFDWILLAYYLWEVLFKCSYTFVI
jgi:hypothetical protein